MIRDWKQFLTNNGVAWRDRGPNVASGNVVVHCPFCGSGDHGEHMGINLATGAWGCWRNREHRGRNPVRLVAALLGCRYDRAVELVGGRGEASLRPDSEFEAQVADMLGERLYVGPPDAEPLELADAIRPLPGRRDRAREGPFFFYATRGRGAGSYALRDWERACELYDLHGALRGPFAYRIIFPVYDVRHGLMSFTGRAVDAVSDLRYRTLSTDPEKTRPYGLRPAKAPISDLLFNLHELQEQSAVEEALVVTEGPFDAMRVDFFGRTVGVRATCLFTKSISDSQLALLQDLAPKFRRLVVLLDQDAALDGMLLPQLPYLSALGFELRTLTDADDPGDMTKDQVYEFCSSLLD